MDNYSYIRENLYIPPLIDDMVVYGVIEPVHRQTILKCNHNSIVGWTIIHIIKIVQTDKTYQAFMLFLKDKARRVFEELVRREESIKTLTGELMANHFVTLFVFTIAY